MNCRWMLNPLCVFMLVFASHLSAAELVVNGDFETEWDSFVVWPGYVGGANDDGDTNPIDVPEWTGSGGRGINPIDAPPPPGANPSQIPQWPGTGGRGVNPVVGGNDDLMPFNAGFNDDAFAFLQGTASIEQTVSGMTQGAKYLLSIDYNARDCCEGELPAAELLINGRSVDNFPDPDLLFDGGLESSFDDWYNFQLPITADGTDLNISISTFPAGLSTGDSTLIVDNISLVPEGGGADLVANGTFDEDVEEFVAWPGYVGPAGDNPAPFRDNGDNNTAVAFMQGAATLEQEVEGFVVGEEYTLSLDFNARNCCGDVPIAELFLGSELIEDFPGEDHEEGIFPVGGNNPWYHFETTFVAESTSTFLTINSSSFGGGDATLVIDNVSISSGPALVGDFNENGELDVDDIDMLSAAAFAGNNPAEFDLNGDGNVDQLDRSAWIVELKNTWFGDSNLDGEFNSSDFVLVFTGGEYEDAEGGNSTWAEGDWNGDGEFNSSDFVVAFSGGGFEVGPRVATQTVPEPGAIVLIVAGLLGLTAIRRNS